MTTEPQSHPPSAVFEMLRWFMIALMVLGIIAAVASAGAYIVPPRASMSDSPDLGIPSPQP